MDDTTTATKQKEEERPPSILKIPDTGIYILSFFEEFCPEIKSLFFFISLPLKDNNLFCI